MDVDKQRRDVVRDWWDTHERILAIWRILIPLTVLLLLTVLAFGQDATASNMLSSTTCPGSGCVQLGTPGRGGGAVQLTGTWSGTAQFEATVDGSLWFSMPVSTVAVSPVVVTSATANGRWTFAPAGYAQVRVRFSALASGNPIVAVRASSASAGSSGGGGGGGGTVAQGASNGGSDPWSVTCASGCAGGTSDTDDGSVAAGQTTGLNIGLTQVYDGAVWRRLAFGQALMASSLPVAIASNQSGVPVTSAGLTNLDVLLSTRTKPADQQHAILDSGTTTVTQGTGSNLHVAVDSAPTTAVTVATLPALTAGAAIIGKVGIDQTTPGTTNGVQVNAALPAGTNVIGHVIHDTGSTTAVTGNVTVVQPTGTNLHAVLDTTSTTAVTQATAANLNATVVQGTATNLKTQAENYQGGTAVSTTNALYTAISARNVSQAMTVPTDSITVDTRNTAFFVFTANSPPGGGTYQLDKIVGSGVITSTTTGNNWPSTTGATVTIATANTSFITITAESITNPFTLVGVASGFDVSIDGLVSTVESTRGQTTMAASIPVTIASNQTGVPVTNASLTSLGATVGTAGSSTIPVSLQVVAGVTKGDAISTVQPLPLAPGGMAVLGYDAIIKTLPLNPCNAVRRTNCQPKGY
jgi:hypothetical protein